MKYEQPDYKRMYEAERDAKESFIARAKDMEVTFRDQLAAEALNGLLSYSVVNPMSGNYHENCTCLNAAQAAYGYADAMLEARKEKQ